jgi:hypothetical protein
MTRLPPEPGRGVSPRRRFVRQVLREDVPHAHGGHDEGS